MKHLSYEFPSESGQRWDVRPITFRSFFNECSRVSIPLFQRKYCWTEDQIKIWFYDLTTAHPRFTSGRGHSVGKIMFKKEPVPAVPPVGTESRLICIDGQQRITTTLLSLAALRDTIYRHLDTHFASQVVTEEDGSPMSLLANRLIALTADIDSVLFSDKHAFDLWESGIIYQTQLSERCRHGPSSAASDCFSLPSSRLQPSYLDRLPYFETITIHKLNRKLKEQDKAMTNSINSSQSLSLLPYHEATLVSVQHHVKTQFEVLILADINKISNNKGINRQSQASPAVAGVTNSGLNSNSCSQPDTNLLKLQTDRFHQLFSKILDYFSFVYMEFLNDDIELPQLFLWLQEKSIFSMGALLFNPAPGIKFAASDLVRNLLMSEIIFQSNNNANSNIHINAKAQLVGVYGTRCEAMEDVYRELWIIPLEEAFLPAVSASEMAMSQSRSRYEDMDSLLEAFANHVQCVLRHLKPRTNPGTLQTISDSDHADNEEAVNSNNISSNNSSSIDNANNIDKDNSWIVCYYSPLSSSFENTLKTVVAKFGKAFNAQDNKGILLYSRVYSLFENLRRHFDERKALASSVTISKSPSFTETTATTDQQQQHQHVDGDGDGDGDGASDHLGRFDYGPQFVYDPESRSSGYLAARLLLRDLAIFHRNSR